MKLHPEDPRLTALILGELSDAEAAAIRAAIKRDPALQDAVSELEKSSKFLTHSLARPPLILNPEQRKNILHAAREADKARKISSFPSPSKIFIMGFAAAAAVMLALWISNQQPSPDKPLANIAPAKPEEIPLELAMLPAPGPPDETHADDTRVSVSTPSKLTQVALARSSAMEQKDGLFLQKVAERISNSPVPNNDDFPQLRPRGEIAAASQPALPLPVQAGVSSLIWITRTIREDHKHPPLNAVRLEEILNQFSLRPNGTTAISQGASISSESITCPWKPSAILLLVSFRGASDGARDVSARFVANPANVRHYRLLGFSTVSDLAPTPLPTCLPAKTVTSLVLEIDPSTTQEDLGSIEWSVNQNAAPALALVRKADTEPSDDARFAALVCTYAQWLINQPADMIDKEMLAALARENTSATLADDRKDFLTLIDQSLNL